MSIRPNCAAHVLHVGSGTMNSPEEPAVELWATDGPDGLIVGQLDQLTPAQAREYARMILAAADKAEKRA